MGRPILILLVVALDALLVFGGGRLLRYATSSRIEPISPSYLFLLFPAGDTPLYATESPQDTTPVGTLDRAVLARYEEIVAGSIGVNLPDRGYAYARMADLRFAVADPAPYLTGICRALPVEGTTGLTYSMTSQDGIDYSTLTVIDDPHIRSETYRYQTSGATILSAYTPKLFHPLMVVQEFMLFVVLLIPIGIVAMAVAIRSDRKSSDDPPADPPPAAPAPS